MASDPSVHPPHWRLRIILISLPLLAISFVLAAQLWAQNKRAVRRLANLGDAKAEILLLKDRLRDEVSKNMELAKELEISKKQLKAVETAQFKTRPRGKMASRSGSQPASDESHAGVPATPVQPETNAVSPRSEATSPALGGGPG